MGLVPTLGIHRTSRHFPYRIGCTSAITTEHAPSSEATPLVTRPPTTPDMTSRPRSPWTFGVAIGLGRLSLPCPQLRKYGQLIKKGADGTKGLAGAGEHHQLRPVEVGDRAVDETAHQ